MSDPKYINELDLRREIRALPDYGELWRTAMKRFLDCINEVPAADVVEVVRCKNCRHRGTIFCGMRKSPNAVKDYSFCSEGERKNG